MERTQGISCLDADGEETEGKDFRDIICAAMESKQGISCLDTRRSSRER